MKQKTFALRHLTFAVIGTMTATVAMANTAESEPMVDLGHEVITIDRQGTKVKTNVVTLQEKDESTATSMRELLKEEPAIDIGGGTGASQFLTIRGMGQNSVDVKVDNAYSDSQILYHQGRFILDPSLVKIVSVQKGAGSASAGIGATNGAIVAKTVDAKDLLANSDKDYGFKLNLGYSSNDSHNYGATVFARSGVFDGLLSYNVKDESNFKPGKDYKNDIDGGDYAPYSALETTSYLAKVGATLDNHRFVLSHMKDEQAGVRTVREEFSALNNNPRLTMIRQAPAYRETSLSNTNLEWTADNLGFVEKMTANAYVMKNERYSADDRGCGYCGYGNASAFPNPVPTTTKIETKGANLNLDVGVGENTLVKYGLNYRHQEIEPGKVDTAVMTHTPEKTDMGAYVEAIGYAGDFTVTGGVRYDHFDITANDGVNATGSNLNPSFGVIYQATPNLSFSANHNYASRSPRLYDALMVGLRRTSISPNIKAEQARNTEVGFNYNNGNFGLDATYFWQKVDDVIVNPQDRHGANNQKEAVNDGYSKNHGYEVGVSYRYNGLTARLGVAESNPEYFLSTTSEVNPEFAVPVGRTWTSSLAYRFAEPNLELGVRNRTVEDSEDAVVAGANISSRKGYSVTDVFANWKPYGNDKMNVNFSVNNLEDKFYYPHSQRAAPTTFPGVGREYRVGVNFTY
ncbi:Heme/hemopexin utilization protein C precursor [Moraxella lacunata]|uniref:Heme/hemopexin utilization protein C n=1 Tax=Moraxella lacunata TaxID=477 RepID=A0A378T9A6_MORLA|nr:TonB-dependent siderophore receptor [Moraxella lacunata]STZ56445.1 Heme/hemopexin utilization protein C precursor [Moraxella lacunata]